MKSAFSWLQVCLLSSILVAATFSFSRSFILRDFPITGEIDCDPTISLCYARQDEETGVWSYYAVATKYAASISPCGLFDEGCFYDFSCADQLCKIDVCDPETVVEGEMCMDPESYAATQATNQQETGTSQNSPEDGVDE